MTRLDAPATGRNRAPILAILARWLATGEPIRLLEIASGTGQHAVHFAAALPHVAWQPSDPDADSLASIAAWRAESGLANLAAPIRLDVRDAEWGVGRVDAIFNANMIHIAPWAAAEGLFAGAGRVLAPFGLLFLYGPFFFADRPTVPSNQAFDASLRARDAEWGVRAFEQVVATAARAGLDWVETNDMPANNFLIVFRRSALTG
jgi:Protein of unknown function (DUF938)